MRGLNPIVVRIILSLLILAVAVAVVVRHDESDLLGLAASIPPGIYTAALACLLLNTVAAAARFNFIAARTSGAWRFRDAIAVVSASSMAGAMFFQLAGQLAARGAIMARAQSGAFANAVVITAYERISAAAVSALGALAGAYIVFGRVYFDWGTGAPLAKLTIVGTLALVVGIAVSGAASSLLPKLNAGTVGLWAGSFLLSICVQIPVMAAYMLAAHVLAPQAPLPSLLGATMIVMFAASIPISFAGWGIRELSAVLALGAIGVSPAQAVLTAILVGIGTMLASGIFAAVTLPAVLTNKPSVAPTGERIDYAGWLATAVPLAAAIAVPFQIHLPVSGSIVNVNLADPIALVGAALFTLRYVSGRRLPVWRHRLLWFAAILATLAITLSLFIGFAHFGVTTWAVINRFVGWLVLLAYVATGALIVTEKGTQGAILLAQAFLGAMAAVAGAEIVLLAINAFHKLGDDIVSPFAVEGMAQNRNAFAFQLLLAIAVGIGLRIYERALFAGILLLLTVTLFLTFSRSGLGTLAALTVLAVAMSGHGRGIAMAALVCVAAGAAIYAVMVGTPLVAQFNFDPLNISERMVTITNGLRLFVDHPLWGAGLGAFRNEGHLSLEGQILVIHSTYVWLLAETGLFGFLSLVVPAAAIILSEWRRVRLDKVAVAIVLCFAVMAIMGLPADMLYQRTFWILTGALLMVPAVVPDESDGRPV